MLQVVSVAATFCEVWEGVTALIAEVDVLAGFAELATSAPVAYVRPTMLPSDAGEIKLIGCRWVSAIFCKSLPAAYQQQLPPSTCRIWSRGGDGHFRHLRVKSFSKFWLREGAAYFPYHEMRMSSYMKQGMCVQAPLR